ncbi:hypothetical protein BJF93_05535 [Xaviernesmea oryzae]|uniref:Uncharacterized protein n=1 Tax=Xaviernesmea oryzae TaxID=464029 RepID=A0A1Q9ARV3_9HYPH|nr:hypothetical protein [Xaviernesmea oryzae]OLP58096.1 hypothetical protein BJF93_05535 [Xaviernesmea oryzae]SEL82957.1 hypothetical protein SAMN04487976_11397 [Xaviernesmea oryzae]
MHRSILFALSLSFALPAAAEDGRLKAADIKEKIVGRTIYLAAPMGGEFPLNYRTNGEVDGDGQALGIGKLVKPSDSGKWWIADDRLCQQFKTWYDGNSMCFVLSDAGPNKVKWVRNNGETGIARIGN